MTKYKVIKNGVEINGWTSDFANASYWEPGFGKKAGFYPQSKLSEAELAQEISRQTVDGLGNLLAEPLIEIPDQFTIEITDITAEIILRNQEKTDRNLKRQNLKLLKGKNLSSSEIKSAVEMILDVLDLHDEALEET